MRWRGGGGALAEPGFQLLFASESASALGNGVAIVALAFAVLDVSSSAAALGLVLAARQVTQALVILVGGVWADRLPRHRILVGAALVQAAAQAASAALLLGGRATVAALAGLQALYGIATGFDAPASIGIVPDTVSEPCLQEANALLSLSWNVLGVLGPALGGVIVALGGAGIGLAIDAASFVAAAALLLRIRLRPAETVRARRFLAELRAGWHELTGRTWLWTTVLLFGIGNFVSASYFVLGPVVAKGQLGGSAAWATLLSAFGAGSVLGGLVALRIRPRRPLLVSILAVLPSILQPVMLAVRPPLPAMAAVSVAAGVGIAIHLTLWFTVFQQQVPREAMSRVSSYDALGSFILIPVGSALAGPVASAVGVDTTLVGAAAVSLGCILLMATLPSVWAIRGAPPPALQLMA